MEESLENPVATWLARSRELATEWRETVLKARTVGPLDKSTNEYGALWGKAYEIERALRHSNEFLLKALDAASDYYDPRTVPDEARTAIAARVAR
jgi:fructose-specific component phosphotransferase system IIB-like protein